MVIIHNNKAIEIQEVNENNFRGALDVIRDHISMMLENRTILVLTEQEYKDFCNIKTFEIPENTVMENFLSPWTGHISFIFLTTHEKERVRQQEQQERNYKIFGDYGDRI